MDVTREVHGTHGCIFCGYNGEGYWQRGTHDARCPWFNVGGEEDRGREFWAMVRATWKRMITTDDRVSAVVADRDAARADALRLHGEAVSAITDKDAALARAEASEVQIAAFVPYLKEGETPIERLERERADNDLLLRLLAKEKAHIDNAVRVEARRIASRDKEIADLQIERSLADKATAAARADRDRFQAERDALQAALATAERKRDEARKDAAYHAECRPNRQQAEAAMADAKATNDRWANAIAERDHLRDLLREVEWVSQHGKITGPAVPEWAWCPCCGCTRQEDHASDCRLKAALEGK